MLVAVALCYNQWKRVFAEQRTYGMEVWRIHS